MPTDRQTNKQTNHTAASYLLNFFYLDNNTDNIGENEIEWGLT